jgi:hypothetical protein
MTDTDNTAAEATARPWKQITNRVYGPDEQPAHDSDTPDYRDLVAKAVSNANAELIVTAVNSFHSDKKQIEQLRAALKRALHLLQRKANGND